ncbi:MAG: YgjV family protein [Oscillospiraceae bacterium]|nr:YgjV family protein [Oscillospiraceae bacterium]
MSASTYIELFGYLGSLLVLVSFLLTSVVKLRIVNTIGSVIFAIYALIIHSYPTAVMNFCLVGINLYYLWKMSKAEKVYDLTSVKEDDYYLAYLLNKYGEDIKTTFPGVDLDTEKIDRAYVISCEGKPVGITLGKDDGENLNLTLDYTIPQYRDFSVGKFLFSRLTELGYKTATYDGSVENHQAYLQATGFEEDKGVFVKKL